MANIAIESFHTPPADFFILFFERVRMSQLTGFLFHMYASFFGTRNKSTVRGQCETTTPLK